MMNYISEQSSFYSLSLLTRNEPCVIYFYKDQCLPCNDIFPRLKALAKKHNEYVFVKLNIHKHPDIAFLYNIDFAPSFIVFEKNVEILRGTGTRAFNELEKYIEARICTQ